MRIPFEEHSKGFEQERENFMAPHPVKVIREKKKPTNKSCVWERKLITSQDCPLPLEAILCHNGG